MRKNNITNIYTQPGLMRVSGFSLIELIVTVGIAGILLAVAAPNFSRALQSAEEERIVNPLLEDLNAARNTAISKQVPVEMCAIENDGTDACCRGTCSNLWDDGWMVFTDCDGDGELTTGANVCFGNTEPEQILSSKATKDSERLLVTASGTPAFTSFTFLPNGMLQSNVAPQIITVDGQPLNGTYTQYQISANLAGRISKTETKISE